MPTSLEGGVELSLSLSSRERERGIVVWGGRVDWRVAETFLLPGPAAHLGAAWGTTKTLSSTE